MALNIHFYCRPSRTNKRGLATIEMAVSLDGAKGRQYIPMDLKVKPADFEQLYNSKKDNYIKEYTDSVEVKVREIVAQMNKRNIPLTTQNLITYYKQGGFNKICTLDELFAEYIEIKNEEYESGKITKITYNRYELCKKRFYEYCGFKGNENVAAVNIGHWKTFEAALRKKHKVSYVAGFLKKIKSIFKYAFETGRIDRLPFVGTKIERGKSVITWLDEKTDLKKIEDKVFESERLEKTKDVFLFQCYTGLAYADMRALNKSDYKQGPDKYWFIKGTRQKTGREFYCVLINDAVNILKKYDFELPVISYPKYNQYIKEVCSLCGIEIHASTHLARRTCACNLLNNGVDIEVVAKMLGDTPEMIRQHYAVLFDKSVLNAVTKYDGERLKKQIEEIFGMDDKNA